MVIRPLNRDALKRQFDSAEPFRHLVIDNFLDSEFAREVAASYLTFDQAVAEGFTFDFVNERKKVQITDASRFPSPVMRLNEALASPGFLADIEFISGISDLQADPGLSGAGMHITGPHGRLDVHVDFNYSEERDWYRRLNILVYLNPEWDESWGGAVELWDRDVKTCHHALAPVLNRCVLFETSHYSFHGVQPLTCPPEESRQSFAAYYYTKDPASDFIGQHFSTIFRARPGENLSRYVLMPMERTRRFGQRVLRLGKRGVKALIGRSGR